MNKKLFSIIFGVVLIFGLNINTTSAQELIIEDHQDGPKSSLSKCASRKGGKNPGGCVKKAGLGGGERCKKEAKGKKCAGTFFPV